MKFYFLIIYLFVSQLLFSLDYNNKIVIFCYHKIEKSNNPYSISEVELQNHIITSKNKGFEIISERQLYNFYYNNISLPPLSFLITFDDGFKECIASAYPILKENNATALFFINSDMIGNEPYLSWNEISFILENDMYIGNHSATHSDFNKKNASLINEIIKSNDIIYKKTNFRPISYAHPFGIYNPKIEEITNYEYMLVYTTNMGHNMYESNPKRLKRYVITKDMNDNISKYFDYHNLPVSKTVPNEGEYLSKDGLVYFYFEKDTLNRFINFKLSIKNKEYPVIIENDIISFDMSLIKFRTLSISLIADDNFQNEYIYSVTLNKK